MLVAEIGCACGCGATLEEYDGHYRTRRFVSGHNSRNFLPASDNSARDASRRWAAKNRRENPLSVKEAKLQRYKDLKLKAMALRGNACEWCGMQYNGKNAPIFEFHHTDPATKETNLSKMWLNKAWATVLEELEKCAMICAYCHNVHHGGEW